LIKLWNENRAIVIAGAIILLVVLIVVIALLRRRPGKREQTVSVEEKKVVEPPAKPEETTAAEKEKTEVIFGKVTIYAEEKLIGTYPLTSAGIKIGRDPTRASVVIAETIVSKLHCELFVRDGKAFIRDLNSTNGIYLNEEKISEKELHGGETIFIGQKGVVKIVFEK